MTSREHMTVLNILTLLDDAVYKHDNKEDYIGDIYLARHKAEQLYDADVKRRDKLKENEL